MASLMVQGPDGRRFRACIRCGREVFDGLRLCIGCGARRLDAAHKRALKREDPETPEPPERRSFNQRLAEGFAMLGGRHCS